MSLQQKAISGSVWTIVSNVTKALIQLLRLKILAQFLEKSDFGVVAIVVLILGFTQIFADIGISTALFSRNDLTQKQKSTLYWLGIGISIILYSILFITAPLIAHFYESEILHDIIPILSLDLIILAAARQFRVYKQKDLQFKQISIIDISTSVISLFIAYALASNGYGVYSLIASTLFASFFSSLLILLTSLKLHPIKLYFKFSEVKSVFNIGLYQSGAQILDYIASQLDIIILGKMLTLDDFGVYSLTKQVILKLYALINPVFSSIGIPILSKIKDNGKLFVEKYIEGLGVVALFTSFIYGLLAILSFEALVILYNDSYTEYASLLSILCIWAALSSLGNFGSSIVVVFGQTKLNLKWTFIRIIFSILFVLVGTYWGVYGVAIAQVLFSTIFYFVYWKLIVNQINPNITLILYSKDTYLHVVKSLIISLFVIFFLKGYILEYVDNITLRTIILIMTFSLLYYIFNKKHFDVYLNRYLFKKIA